MVLIKKCGYASKFSSTNVKINQYKTYIRSSHLYGFENMLLNKNEIDLIQTTESNMIKKSLALPPRFTKSTFLNRAFRTDNIRNRLFKNKTKFLKRVKENEFTRELTDELITSEQKILKDKKSLIGYMNKQTNGKSMTFVSLINECEKK